MVDQSFNPRARAGRDKSGLGLEAQIAVSIHAPARGATGEHEHTRISYPVSIHAPARGAT